MAEKRYYWLKLKEDYFNSPKIKKLRKIAGGDTYTIIYLKMQLLSVKNGGAIQFEGIENTFEEELALKLDEQLEDVQLTLSYLKNQMLIEENENSEYLLIEASNNIGSESQSAERVRKFREKQGALQCNANVTQVLQNSISISNSKSNIDYNNIMDIYNNKCPSLPKCTTLSARRKTMIKARLKDYTIEQLIQVFEMAEASDFLKGKNDRGWTANIDWLLNDTNFCKVLDGNYKNKAISVGNYNETRTNQNLNNLFDDLNKIQL